MLIKKNNSKTIEEENSDSGYDSDDNFKENKDRIKSY